MDPENQRIIYTAGQYLRMIGKQLEHLSVFGDELAKHLHNLEHEPSTQNQLLALSLLAYFEKHLAPQMVERKKLDKVFDKDPNVFTIYLADGWRAFEFDNIFGSIDFLNKFFVIATKLRSSDVRLRREMTRAYVYNESRLYYYLSPHEELRINRIEYASPGLISFRGIADAVSEVRSFIENTISFEFVRKIFDNYDYIKHTRKTKIQEEKNKLREAISKTELDAVKERTEKLKAENEYDLLRIEAERQKLEAIKKSLQEWKEIAGIIEELDDRKLLRGDILENKLMQSAMSLHQLGFDANKISLLPKDADGSEN